VDNENKENHDLKFKIISYIVVFHQKNASKQ